MRIAIATSEVVLPPSDAELAAAFRAQGVDARPVIWSLAGVPWREFDAVLVRSCWDYHLREAEFLEWLGSLEGVRVLNDPRLIRWNLNKSYLRELGVAIPDTVWVGAGEEADVAAICAARGWARAVVKPLVSASAYRTAVMAEGIALGEVMVQEFLRAIETDGEWSLMWFDHEFSHAVRKRPGAGDFRVQMEHGGSAEAAVPDAELLEFTARAMARLPYRAAWARVDVVRDGDRLLLMELEAIEPELFLGSCKGAAERLVEVVV